MGEESPSRQRSVKWPTLRNLASSQGFACNMNTLLFVVATTVALVSAAPQRAEEPIAIISQTNNFNGDGTYEYSYETANGIKAQEVGTLKKAQNPEDGNVVVSQGSYTYKTPEGIQITLQYVADDVGGFVPVGDHLPTAPPVPPAIQKALDYLASLPPTPETPRGRR
ncbi:endocuticle structural glycoprotein ABD-4-like [Periplaneta americana]|uniref:endocuticle structural glycoprotein ABD-4-like n=1 Tax=Periplaneta americana TaxID=6978 RepID=UPI0037E769D9